MTPTVMTGEVSAEDAATGVLVNPARTLPALQGVMRRVGTRLPPDRFIAEVARAYQLVKYLRHREDTSASFRRSVGHKIFLETLQFAVSQLSRPLDVLIVGCGPGFAGLTSSYAVASLAECVPAAEIGRWTCLEASPRRLRQWVQAGSINAPPADLLISHSLLHFVPNPGPLLTLMQNALKPSGLYVMAHEPNARYWQNRECQQVLEEFETNAARNRRSALAHRLRGIAGRLRQLIPGPRKSRGFAADLQHLLRRRLDLRSHLQPAELNRIVDPHRRGSRAATFSIGWDGIDCDQLAATSLSQVNLLWRQTYDHLGYIPADVLSPQLRERESSLRMKYPDDGMAFTAIWRRAGQASSGNVPDGESRDRNILSAP